MSPRTWLERIQDILACAHNIQEFTANMNLDAFLKDPRTVRAVAFELTTMGEAARAIPVDVQERYSHLPWDKMQAIRNVLVHLLRLRGGEGGLLLQETFLAQAQRLTENSAFLSAPANGRPSVRHSDGIASRGLAPLRQPQ